MGKKASFPEIKRAQIINLHKNRFSPKKICKTRLEAKRLFIKQLLDFKILDFTMTRKGMEGQEKKALLMTT